MVFHLQVDSGDNDTKGCKEMSFEEAVLNNFIGDHQKLHVYYSCVSSLPKTNHKLYASPQVDHQTISYMQIGPEVG